MSDDLISRQAVVKIIDNEIKSTTAYCLHDTQINIKFDVQNLPTAYDVEKVIEQLQKAKTRMSCYRLNNVADDRISINEAIEIVRKGGIKE